MELRIEMERSVLFDGLAPAAGVRKAVYEVRGSDVALFAMWDKKVRQSVKSVSALSTHVAVLDVADPQAIAGVEQDAPTEACSTASTLVPSEHPTIEKLVAKLLEADLGDEFRHAKSLFLAKRLSEIVTPTPLSANVVKAVDTARVLEGDFIAQSLLLTTVLRNQGIPARVASGLKVDPADRKLKFYMWTEAWQGEQWLPIDAVTGLIAGLDCLKMFDSDLSEDNPYSAILPVFENMQHIQVKLLETE